MSFQNPSAHIVRPTRSVGKVHRPKEWGTHSRGIPEKPRSHAKGGPPAPDMARLTLARKLAAIVLVLWKKGEKFDPKYLTPQAA